MARPNILFILSDDQGYGDLGCFGNTHIATPHLDALAKGGVRLTQHYAASPLCAPARAGLLTGRYNHRTGALSVESNRGIDRIHLRERTLGDYFHQAGYATGYVGKWHNGLFDRRHHPNSRGFQEFAGFLNGGMDYWDWILDIDGQPRRRDGRYLTDVFTGEACGFIARHAAEPFCLFLAYNAPHQPLQAPEEDIRPFAQTGRFTPAVSTLYGMIRRMDAGIGRLIDSLRTHGLLGNTLVVFTSDNGPVLGGEGGGCLARYNGPFRGQKNWVLEGGLRVPAIAHWPAGLPANREHHGLVHHCDWLPTLLSAACINAAPSLPLDGLDHLAAIQGENEPVDPVRFWQHNRYAPFPHVNAAMRDGPWKLLFDYPEAARRKLPEDNDWYRRMFREPHFETGVDLHEIRLEGVEPGPPQLYHLGDDPHEQHDLAAVHPQRLAAMQRAYDTWFADVETERRTLENAWGNATD